MSADYLPSAPINDRLGRDNTDRLRELILTAQGLNTFDALKRKRSAETVLELSRRLAKEIGLDLKNPAVPKVCRMAGGDCGCGGQC